MRFVFVVFLTLLAVGLIGFHVTNLDSTVTLMVWNTPHEDVHVGYVAIISVLVGALLAGTVAIVEGTRIRLENRRLAREIRKMETEINFLRTQPAGTPRLEPDALDSGRTAPAPRADLIPRPTPEEPSSAPVYEADRGDWPDDDDDDIYSGGRAV